jgi:hypothetical protein
MSNLVSTSNTEKIMQPSIDDWVKENLRYDPETGHIWWIKQNVGSGSRRNLNRPAGSNSAGYLFVTINFPDYRITLYLHRVAWFFYYGVWPKDQVDHINNNRSDNRIVNLREATAFQNQANRKIQMGGSSKYKGVSWFKQSCKWEAYIEVNRKKIHLGYYHKEEEAALTYNKAALERFGEFAKINIIEPLDTGMTNTYISSSSGELSC